MAAGATLGFLVVAFFGQDRRLVSIVSSDGVSRMDFTYDYAGVRVGERSSGDVLPAVNRVTPDSLFSVENGVLTLHLYDSQGVVAWRTVDGAVTYLHPDHQGSLSAITDPTGALLETIRYDPYGKIIERTAAGPRLAISFGGGMLNDWSGLICLLSRHYHPGLGRFVSPDILVGDVNIPISWNPYAYCGNNPATYIDPTGTWFFLIPFVVGFVAGLIYGLADGKSLGDSLGIAAETAHYRIWSASGVRSNGHVRSLDGRHKRSVHRYPPDLRLEFD